MATVSALRDVNKIKEIQFSDDEFPLYSDILIVGRRSAVS
jgi:hypothetical protein